MKAKTLNGKDVDVLLLDPGRMFAVLVGLLERSIVDVDEFPSGGSVYLYQKPSETPDEYQEDYDILVRNSPDAVIPPLEELLENDAAVIGKADYTLETREDGATLMRFKNLQQFDCLYEVDENGVIDIEE